ncbi:MAG: DedA family protein [Sarcina sp.]
MGAIIDKIMDFSIYLINILGYPGIFIAGALEFLGIPVSGEVLIPIAGFMTKSANLNLILSFIVLNVGSIIATLCMYGVGYYFNDWANRLIRKKLYKNEEKLNNLNAWFNKNGTIVSLISRFIPFARVYVSLVAGIERIPVIPFTIYSSVGIVSWNAFFFFAGYYLGDKFKDYKSYINYLSNNELPILIITIIVLLIIIGIIFIRRILKKKKENN